MSRRNSLPITLEQVEAHNARVKAGKRLLRPPPNRLPPGGGSQPVDESMERGRGNAHVSPSEPSISAVPAVSRRKHGNVPTVVDGIRFDSKHEARCWQDLKLREKAGEIRCLQRQVSFPLEVAGSRIQRFRADFWYLEQVDRFRWEVRVADAKSSHTASLPAWRRTSALFTALYGLDVTIL